MVADVPLTVKLATYLLKHGRDDPDKYPATLLPSIAAKAMASLMSTSHGEGVAIEALNSAALPKMECAGLVKFMQKIVCGWKPSLHHLYHSKVQEAVVTVLLVAQRLERRAWADLVAATDRLQVGEVTAMEAGGAEGAGNGNGSESGGGADDDNAGGDAGGGGGTGAVSPLLPPELWWGGILRFLSRRDWDAVGNERTDAPEQKSICGLRLGRILKAVEYSTVLAST